MKPNTLYYGDCMEVMQDWPDACVDLIYLDPPFNSNADYNILFGSQKTKVGKVKRKDLAQITAFTDTWEWDHQSAERTRQIIKSINHRARDSVRAFASFFKGNAGMLAYLVYMADRINLMYRTLKPTGSIYLHCNPTASHYLKMLMDDVFGVRNFRNEIVWCYTGPSRPGTKNFLRKHDIILRYTKSARWTWHRPYIPYKSKRKLYKGYETTESKITPELEENYHKRGKPLEDYWMDINSLKREKERIGYPTQKPLALLERIIHASSNQGDMVLDPFCGCGTTIEAAMNLKRDFIGIEASMYALDVIQKERLKGVEFRIDGIPANLSAAKKLAEKRSFAFAQWAIHLIPGFVSNNKQSGDGSIDGWAALLNTLPDEEGMCIAQVKSGNTPRTAEAMRAFTSILIGSYASFGVFITLEKMKPTQTMKACINQAGVLQQGATSFNRLVLWSVQEYFAAVNPLLPTLVNPRTGEPLQN